MTKAIIVAGSNPTKVNLRDSHLLALRQHDARPTAQDLGEMLNLSSSQIGRRRQHLESQG
ncbi:MAG: Lrp/AsnC family transcriptional regulator [Rhodobacteraceae bacterium]|nr:Lrp/AsnC family transcriptional regulator [Paracoccaceae bacterium]